MEEEKIRYLAHLARIQLSEAEVRDLKKDLSQMLDYVGQLKSLETGEVEPTNAVLPAYNRFRKDEVMPSMPVEKALVNAPDRMDDFFRVPRVITERKTNE
ncbi:MAG: Asp-tRNA(Asn)/Glu-tRNA(Gln) amidotransferase subunit GatC [Candidatus Omnitrophota bacterium]